MLVFESSCQIYVIHVNIFYHYLFWLWAVIKAYPSDAQVGGGLMQPP